MRKRSSEIVPLIVEFYRSPKATYSLAEAHALLKGATVEKIRDFVNNFGPGDALVDPETITEIRREEVEKFGIWHHVWTYEEINAALEAVPLDDPLRGFELVPMTVRLPAVLVKALRREAQRSREPLPDWLGNITEDAVGSTVFTLAFGEGRS